LKDCRQPAGVPEKDAFACCKIAFSSQVVQSAQGATEKDRLVRWLLAAK
jgi:hypothetical protein